MTYMRFSKDSKVRRVNVIEFLEYYNYLCGLTEDDFWSEKIVPNDNQLYFYLTPSYIMSICYTSYLANYGTSRKAILYCIDVACRDGKTEYEAFDRQIAELTEERGKYRKSKKRDMIDDKIEELKRAKQLLPIYMPPKPSIAKPSDTYLVQSGYKTSIDILKDKYLVLDVETNGLRTANDDLLSLSIYDPSSGMCYNRFFPLDLQPLILTGYINGITEKTLAGATHMTQEEFDWLRHHFHLQDRILLSYSGGKGTFDFSFLSNYCKRQGIKGLSDLKFQNIKSMIPKVPFGCEGELTKDNMCRLLGIKGVKKKHTGYNDCILEWKLFEKLESECLFFIDQHLYQYNSEYIIPVTYLIKYPELQKYAGIPELTIKGKATEIFRLNFPKRLLKEITKFPTNITGVSIEHGINTYLHAAKQDNNSFLKNNRNHLKYVGSLDSRIKRIPVFTENDGMIKAVFPKDNAFVCAVNDVTKMIIGQLQPVSAFLKEHIFMEGTIMAQELSISDDQKVLALCDLSDRNNVVEIKTCTVLEEVGILKKDIAKQLYYQAKGRNAFVLSIMFDTDYNTRAFNARVNNLSVIIYKIEFVI